MKNFEFIERQRNGRFNAYHPETRKFIGSFDSWCEAFDCVNKIS